MTSYAREPTAATIAAALQHAGYRVLPPTTPGGWYTTTTELCHGGDTAAGLGFRDAEGGRGITVHCFTGDCDTRTAAPKIRAAAGFLNRQAVRLRWTVSCTYRHADGQAVEALRYDHPGGPDCILADRCTEGETPHKHCLPGSGGHPRRGLRIRGLGVHVWQPPETLVADAPLVIAEGEKAAAAISAVGWPAVSWYGGSGKRYVTGADWRVVKGRDCILWPDNDGPGQKAMEYAAAEIAAVGGNVIARVVAADVGDKGADAADVDADRRRALLESVEPWTPPETPDDAAGVMPPNSNGGWLWYPDGGDYLPPWEMTADADCMRTMRQHATDLLAERTPKDTILRVATPGGVWTSRSDDLNQRVAITSRQWAQDALDDSLVSPADAGAIARWRKRTAAQQGRNAALDSVGTVFVEWQKLGTLPPALTVSKSDDLDADTRYLGAPNGVIDLTTGALLTGKEARGCLITHEIKDPYDPTATSADVDLLLHHLPDDAREWLLAAFGHALRGRPNGREYLLVGPTRGGKSTLLQAVSDALGEYGGFVSEKAIAARKYAGGPEPELEKPTYARVMFYSEPPSDIDYRRMKNQSGGDTISFRKMRSDEIIERRTTATRVFACNDDDVPNLPLHLKAVYERLRALPYPSIPEPDRDLGLPDRLNTRPARQALVALLVRYAVANPQPPPDIPSVEARRRELRDSSVGEAGDWLQTALVPDPDGVTTAELWAAARKASGETADGRAWGYTRRRFTGFARSILNLPAPGVHRIGTEGKAQQGWRGYRLATDAERQAHFETMLGQQDATEPKNCRMPDCENQFYGNGLFCVDCDALVQQENVRRLGRVAPAAAIETLANTSPGEMAAIRPLVSQTDAERAREALGTLTNVLENTVQAVADGATLGAQTPDKLANRALPMWWAAVAGMADAAFDPDDESADADEREM